MVISGLRYFWNIHEKLHTMERQTLWGTRDVSVIRTWPALSPGFCWWGSAAGGHSHQCPALGRRVAHGLSHRWSFLLYWVEHLVAQILGLSALTSLSQHGYSVPQPSGPSQPLLPSTIMARAAIQAIWLGPHLGQSVGPPSFPGTQVQLCQCPLPHQTSEQCCLPAGPDCFCGGDSLRMKLQVVREGSQTKPLPVSQASVCSQQLALDRQSWTSTRIRCYLL